MITLKTLPEATAQEVFDQVKTHLLKQGKQAKGNAGCKYKTEDGLKCAAGCLMADDEYDSNYEGKSWGSVAQRANVDSHENLISSLQSIHDRFDPENWPETLKALANNLNLIYHE